MGFQRFTVKRLGPESATSGDATKGPNGALD